MSMILTLRSSLIGIYKQKELGNREDIVMFTIGLIAGFVAGIFFASLCQASARADKENK